MNQEKYQDGQSKFSSTPSFPESLFQEEFYQIHSFEITSMETQNSELTLKEDLSFTSDTYEFEFEGNS